MNQNCERNTAIMLYCVFICLFIGRHKNADRLSCNKHYLQLGQETFERLMKLMTATVKKARIESPTYEPQQPTTVKDLHEVEK